MQRGVMIGPQENEDETQCAKKESLNHPSVFLRFRKRFHVGPNVPLTSLEERRGA